MKRQYLQNRMIRSAVMVAVVGLAWGPSQLLAQEKGAERLLKLNRLNTVAEVQKVEAGDTVVMTCPRCKDTWVTVVQPFEKGVNREGQKVLRHECPGCSTKIVTTGTGKPATDKVVHTCKHCGSTDAFCCTMKKGTGPTAGMEEKK